MKFKAFCAAAVVGTVLLVPGAASAGAQPVSYDTTITIRDVYDAGQAIGSVASPNAKCLPGRTVQVYAIRDGVPKLVDVDQTSRRGFWSGGSPTLTQHTTAIRVKVLSKNIGPRGHAQVCKADTDQFIVA
jgi:hypothetical protein